MVEMDDRGCPSDSPLTFNGEILKLVVFLEHGGLLLLRLLRGLGLILGLRGIRHGGGRCGCADRKLDERV